MARCPIGDLAGIGVVKDRADYMLPVNAWTDARNMRFQDDKLVRGQGQRTIFNPPSVAPYWLLPVITQSRSPGWIYAGLTKIYSFLSATHTDISRTVGGAYAATEDGLWNGGILAGIPILNNGVDIPQYWATIGSGNFANLSNWPAGYLCQIMRPYKNFLIAMGMTETGVQYPHRLRWSTRAQPGGIPSTWDDTDESEDAGISELTDIQAGGIVDGVVLRDTMIIYKERSTWGMQEVGGEFDFRIYQIFENVGALGDHCATPFASGAMHFVATGEDIIVHDGQQVKSVIDKKTRRWMLANISNTRYNRSFVIPNNDHKECWFCFPMEGADWPNLAMIWHQDDNNITFRELDNASFIAQGQIPSDTSDPWSGDGGPWDSDMTPWDELAGVSYTRELVQSNPVATKIYNLDSTQQFNNIDFNAYIERTGLSIYGVSKNGTLLSDPGKLKLVRSIWVRASGPPLLIQVGRQQEIDGPIAWGPTHEFIPGEDEKIDVLDDAETLGDNGGACYLFGVRFTWPIGAPAEFRGYDVDVEPLGSF